MLLVGQPCIVFGQESNSAGFSVTAAILLFSFRLLLSSKTCASCDNSASGDT